MRALLAILLARYRARAAERAVAAAEGEVKYHERQLENARRALLYLKGVRQFVTADLRSLEQEKRFPSPQGVNRA